MVSCKPPAPTAVPARFVIAVVLLASSFGVLSGSQFARWIGIAAGSILTVTSIFWMPYYPIWSFTYIAIGMLVIYALAAYGGRDAIEYQDATEYRAGV